MSVKLERISAIVHSRPTPSRAEQQLPVAGESLLLTYKDSSGAHLLATMGNGLALRLAGLDRWRGDLQPGDTLRVKVLASDPVLELELEGAPVRSASSNTDAADAGTAAMTRHAAMRLDQAVLRQMAWQAPNAAALALSWRELAQGRWGGRGSLPDAGEAPLAAPTTMLGPAPFREPVSTLPPPNLGRWLFPVYAWGGMQMLLGLMQGEEEKPASRPPRRRSLALRLEMTPAALGRIVLFASWQSSGLELRIVVEQSESVQLVREALPLVTAALSRAGLHPVRLRLQQGSAAASGHYPPGAAPTHKAGLTLPLSSFRALAEASVVLLHVLPGQLRINRANR
jgi:hypothetical protein